MEIKIDRFKIVLIILIISMIDNIVHGQKNGFYECDNSGLGQYAFIRNDTIWFNYHMPTGEYHIRFAKGVLQKDGKIDILPIEDRLETIIDTICIQKIDSVNQLILNIFDLSRSLQVTIPIFYRVYEDRSSEKTKRIYLEKPFNHINGAHELDYSNLNVPQAILEFDNFQTEHFRSENFRTVSLDIRKGERAHYKISFVPRVTYSDHFKEIKYSYEKDGDELTIYFKKNITGFPNFEGNYLPIDTLKTHPYLEYVFKYYAQ